MNRLYKVNNPNTIQNRGGNPPRQNTFDFRTYKNNTINSLNEVECFLNDFSRFFKLFKIYKILR